MLHKIDPHFPCVIINEAHIIMASTKRGSFGCPHIRVDHFQSPVAYFSITWKCISSLLAHLACFTYLLHSIHSEFRQTCNNTLCLHRFQPLYVHVPNALVPYFNICNDTSSMRKHSSLHLWNISIQGKHSAISFAFCNQAALIFQILNKTPIRVKSDLQTLLYHLAN